MKKIILSDVDGTITRGSLVLDHATLLHNQGIIDLGSLVADWNADKKNETVISALADAYRVSIIGRSVQSLNVESFIDGIILGNDFYSTLDRLRAARANGTDVELVSGSPSFLVAEFASRFGFTATGSDYFTDSNGSLTGKVGPMFHAAAKRQHVAAMNIRDTYCEVHAYGDTMSDEPLFDAADYSVLVHPTQETYAKLAHKVDELIK